MPLPPILEIFVVWHPGDRDGRTVSDALMDHFHSRIFSGLAGGAVEVYNRSTGWVSPTGPPRPLGITEPWPYGLPRAQFIAVVPVLGVHLARAFSAHEGWREYLRAIFDAGRRSDVGVFPVRTDSFDLAHTELYDTGGWAQILDRRSVHDRDVLCRELSQGIAQAMTPGSEQSEQITVFVSHTKHGDLAAEPEGARIYDEVQAVIAETHLSRFFDATDLQPGTDWRKRLLTAAGRGALLMVRTDQYAEREWTQREVLAAKEHDVPVVGLHALRKGEERGSFLMDHVPTVACRVDDPRPGIVRALNRIVAEALKHRLWEYQRVYLRDGGFDWLPVHSPEPVTTGPWLQKHKAEKPDDRQIWIIHPDPPLGPREHDVLVDMCRLAGFADEVEIFTPRTFASRGGELPS